MSHESDRRTDPDGRARVERALETAASEAATRSARRTARRAAGGYFVLLLVLLIGAGFFQRATNTRLDSANVRLNSSELRACERVQNQRERANISEARQFLLLVAVANSPKASKPVKDRYGTLANTTLYDPPTDCLSAVGHPDTYRRPPSVPFYALPQRYAESIVQAAKDKRPQPTLSR